MKPQIRKKLSLKKETLRSLSDKRGIVHGAESWDCSIMPGGGCNTAWYDCTQFLGHPCGPDTQNGTCWSQASCASCYPCQTDAQTCPNWPCTNIDENTCPGNTCNQCDTVNGC